MPNPKLSDLGTDTECRYASAILDVAVLEWFKGAKPDEVGKGDFSTDYRFGQLVEKAKEFEIVLSAELENLATYHATQKGIYSTPDLIDRAEGTLPASVRAKISPKVVDEIRQSGRCLAFDNPTASGFHIMRATEAVMHQYYLVVCKPNPEPDRLESWGAYIAALQKSTDPSVKETVAVLQQIKDHHRNLIMHPEVVLSHDEAFTLFEIAKGAMMAMATELPEVKKPDARDTRAKKS